MEKVSRALTPGEVDILMSVFSTTIPYPEVAIHNYKAYLFQPDDTAMAPDGSIYFPPKHYLSDFSTASLTIRAWLVHEGAHLYQYYALGWNIKLRGIIDRNYDYVLDPRKKFQQYGLEQQGAIAQDYYTLRNGGRISRPYNLNDFANVLPFPKYE